MDEQTTERGFKIYTTFHDVYGSRIRVQESSSANQARVWIFCDRPDQGVGPSPHLNLNQARMVRAALDRFINEGDSE